MLPQFTTEFYFLHLSKSWVAALWSKENGSLQQLQIHLVAARVLSLKEGLKTCFSAVELVCVAIIKGKTALWECCACSTSKCCGCNNAESGKRANYY